MLERTRLDESGAFTGTGELETLDVSMVLRSVGYQSVPLPGVPFDERAAVVPNVAGRVIGADGEPLPGEYVAGWLKRGPTGVIGTNKSDAAQTVRRAARGSGRRPGPGRARAAPGRAAALPAAPGSGGGGSPLAACWPAGACGRSSYADWLRIEAAEAALGESLGRGGRVKLAGRAALDEACFPPEA